MELEVVLSALKIVRTASMELFALNVTTPFICQQPVSVHYARFLAAFHVIHQTIVLIVLNRCGKHQQVGVHFVHLLAYSAQELQQLARLVLWVIIYHRQAAYLAQQ